MTIRGYFKTVCVHTVTELFAYIHLSSTVHPTVTFNRISFFLFVQSLKKEFKKERLNKQFTNMVKTKKKKIFNNKEENKKEKK